MSLYQITINVSTTLDMEKIKRGFDKLEFYNPVEVSIQKHDGGINIGYPFKKRLEGRRKSDKER
tara:strand:- start:482 stop:673 length:192 start_codon:yes stop_codon:yes gene_type:complete